MIRLSLGLVVGIMDTLLIQMTLSTRVSLIPSERFFAFTAITLTFIWVVAFLSSAWDAMDKVN